MKNKKVKYPRTPKEQWKTVKFDDRFKARIRLSYLYHGLNAQKTADYLGISPFSVVRYADPVRFAKWARTGKGKKPSKEKQRQYQKTAYENKKKLMADRLRAYKRSQDQGMSNTMKTLKGMFDSNLLHKKVLRGNPFDLFSDKHQDFDSQPFISGRGIEVNADNIKELINAMLKTNKQYVQRPDVENIHSIMERARAPFVPAKKGTGCHIGLDLAAGPDTHVEVVVRDGKVTVSTRT